MEQKIRRANGDWTGLWVNIIKLQRKYGIRVRYLPFTIVIDSTRHIYISYHCDGLTSRRIATQQTVSELYEFRIEDTNPPLPFMHSSRNELYW